MRSSWDTGPGGCFGRLVIERGGVYWADLTSTGRSDAGWAGAGGSYKVTDLAAMPGGVVLPVAMTGLPKGAVVTVPAVVTLNKIDPSERVGRPPNGRCRSGRRTGAV
jgi:hypothetical protein